MRERNKSTWLNKIIKLQEKKLKEEKKQGRPINKHKRSNKMAISTYLSVCTLNINGLNDPQDKGWLIRLKNKTHLYAAYKRLTLEIKAHSHWKWEDGKRYFIQMGMTGNLG